MARPGRSIVVGDVHGCADELEDLLERVEIDPSDRVYFVGDLIARGPGTNRVLARFRELGAKGVIGNHELRMLEVRKARQRGHHGPRLGPGHERLLGELSEDDWATLEELPLWLDLPRHGVRLVHAGVVPGRPIEQQLVRDLTRIRSLADGEGSDRYSEQSWASAYSGSPHLVFGHNARLGVQLHECATGLDSGCVYGGSLTALVLPADAAPAPIDRRAEQLVSVPAHRAYYGPAANADA